MYAEEEDDVGYDRNQNVFSCDFHWLIRAAVPIG
jgi:hypothetical protein